VQQAAQLCRDWLASNPNDSVDGHLAVVEMDNGE
jgi:hypothetical protein